MSEQVNKDVTVRFSSPFRPKRWDVLKMNYSGKWIIVIDVIDDKLSTIITTAEINLSKWKWIRNFQIWMIQKIFNTNNH